MRIVFDCPVMPTKLQFTLAHSQRIAAWGGAAILTGFAVWHGAWTIVEYADIRIILLVCLGVLAAPPLGCILGCLTIGPVLGEIAARLNGAPFQKEDRIVGGRRRSTRTGRHDSKRVFP
jgi:hypothetical protein